jgi:hypothetical protein
MKEVQMTHHQQKSNVYSIPPNDFSREILEAFGIKDEKVISFHLMLEIGEPVKIQVTHLVTVENESKLVTVLKKYKLVDNV